MWKWRWLWRGGFDCPLLAPICIGNPIDLTNSRNVFQHHNHPKSIRCQYELYERVYNVSKYIIQSNNINSENTIGTQNPSFFVIQYWLSKLNRNTKVDEKLVFFQTQCHLAHTSVYALREPRHDHLVSLFNSI